LKINPILSKASWLSNDDIRPYVLIRPENRIDQPGKRHHLDWFPHQVLEKNPLHLDELEFIEQIYDLEAKCFGPTNMATPRWVFYDCAFVPGFVSGFAYRTSKLPERLKKQLRVVEDSEWTPLSLFIIIPTIHKGEWVAHNLCSVNALVEKADQFYGIGFLSKAFGLWYANVEQCTGMTQWGSPAVKLHANYGHMEIIGAYGPAHTHATTLTYRVEINTMSWEQFFKRELDYAFLENYEPTSILINPNDRKSMIDLQRRIEKDEGPFFLNAAEVASKKNDDTLTIYKKKATYF
jgi:hypothetical protein